ncbi:hypothetical protein GGE16_003264 [Rhizobium leguminosarum]|uniref:Uncharacterized protein n=1 Tax=Rhizobium leguminosarum TaxID=384 RepID=A0AAE2SX72_RHILE|nr:hypothetical protein [Rhizobium leguminosarum]MBB4430358.1 hypothetical protein [Rhizobium esperanzae]MBB4297699.1 hypothetical protein [Rhizobium leguminosarum]MBB4308839.1 hypothetical protein [Rhizobium leguminosarum]MBB4416674.1 hypothetical protein [Rhizobium leguminosarum]
MRAATVRGQGSRTGYGPDPGTFAVATIAFFAF